MVWSQRNAVARRSGACRADRELGEGSKRKAAASGCRQMETKVCSIAGRVRERGARGRGKGGVWVLKRRLSCCGGGGTDGVTACDCCLFAPSQVGGSGILDAGGGSLLWLVFGRIFNNFKAPWRGGGADSCESTFLAWNTSRGHVWCGRHSGFYIAHIDGQSHDSICRQ